MSATANGTILNSARVIVPWSGVPIAEMKSSEAPKAVNGLLSLSILDFVFSCTLVPGRSGLFVGNWSGYAVGGRNGWGKFIPARAYQSPFGLLDSQIFLDAARECGELPPITAAPRVVGGSYLRRGDLPAKQVFAKVSGGNSWWVDIATGAAHVGPRVLKPTAAQFDLISYTPSAGRLVIATDSPAAFLPGATFTDPQAGAFTVNSATIDVDETAVRVTIWTA